MRAVLFHPLGITLLSGSLLMAGTLRFLPWAGDLSAMAPGVLFLGTLGYTALVVALLWPGPEDSNPNALRLDTGLSDEAVKKRLRSDAFRHPATLLPLALAVVSGCYLVLLASATGHRLAAIATLSLMVVVSAGSFLWHYAIRYRERYGAKLQWLTDMLEEERARTEQATGNTNPCALSLRNDHMTVHALGDMHRSASKSCETQCSPRKAQEANGSRTFKRRWPSVHMQVPLVSALEVDEHAYPKRGDGKRAKLKAQQALKARDKPGSVRRVHSCRCK